MFLFHSKHNGHFALVSDSNLQINSRFVGDRPAGRTHDFTSIQILGLLVGSHTFTVTTNADPIWNSDVDHLGFSFDGAPVQVAEGQAWWWRRQGRPHLQGQQCFHYHPDGYSSRM